ncbi:type II secretion system minor pseudopilin [Thiothrix subterranea]|uniref:Type II secretion system protein GspK n=1 Tax=Thiothrix subterranea TaxID=2735563 RepID=A0AA51QX73_9GAMM|nr:type II secretion system protein GspK [Thiothrix subterranea]MDQ5768391.1 type II secretion system protein GspK [Thiothrix subterranea]WML86978.1 type II secretion system protein GspK [Thiothrix subterranea]
MQNKQSGVAMIVVLWMIMVMMTLAASLLYATRTETSMVDYARRSAQARAVADAAAHYAVMQLFLPNKDRELKLGGTPLLWEYEGSKVEIRAVGENGLVDIGFASPPLIRLILKQAGLDESAIERMLDTLEDFRDVDDLKRINGAEDADYDSAGLPFGAKDAPFERIEELQQVLGMTPPLYQALTRLLTVNSGGKGINPMLAPRQTLLLLAEGDAAKVDAYMQQRAESDGEYVQPDFGAEFLDPTQQPLYRMQIRVYSDETAPPYFEERSLRLNPGQTPPFVNYFRILQESSAQFE